MDFTNEELYEIEKQFDILAGTLRIQGINALKILSECTNKINNLDLDKKIYKYEDDMLDSYFHAFDTFMNIRAKASLLRKKQEKHNDIQQ